MRALFIPIRFTPVCKEGNPEVRGKIPREKNIGNSLCSQSEKINILKKGTSQNYKPVHNLVRKTTQNTWIPLLFSQPSSIGAAAFLRDSFKICLKENKRLQNKEEYSGMDRQGQ